MASGPSSRLRGLTSKRTTCFIDQRILPFRNGGRLGFETGGGRALLCELRFFLFTNVVLRTLNFKRYGFYHFPWRVRRSLLAVVPGESAAVESGALSREGGERGALGFPEFAADATTVPPRALLRGFGLRLLRATVQLRLLRILRLALRLAVENCTALSQRICRWSS